MRRTGSRVFGVLGAAALAAGLVLSGTQAAWAATGWELAAMSVPAAWRTAQGEGVTVAVVDTGVRVDHPVLKGRAKEGPDLLDENDKNEKWYGVHGTAMASNVLDVAPKAQVLGLRAIRDKGDPDYEDKPDFTRGAGKRDPLRAAISTAIDSGAQVISLSLGSMENMGGLNYSAELAADIAYANARGVVVVAAAGNEGAKSNDVSYPAAYPGVLVAGAATPAGKRASFSNVHSYVDVLAPGTKINSADAETGGRSEAQGTSAATALLSGVVALIRSAYPKLTPHQVEKVLVETASNYRDGHSPFTGYGRVDAAAALKAAAALTPGEAVVATPHDHAGPAHFGPGDNGVPKMVGEGLESEPLAIGSAIGVLGLLVIIVGFVLLTSGRKAARSTARAATVGPPQSGQPAAGPPQFGPPQFGQPPAGPSQYGQPPVGPSQYGQPPVGPPQFGPPPAGPPKDWQR